MPITFKLVHGYANWLIRKLFHHIWLSIRSNNLIAEHKTDWAINSKLLVSEWVFIFTTLLVDVAFFWTCGNSSRLSHRIRKNEGGKIWLGYLKKILEVFFGVQKFLTSFYAKISYVSLKKRRIVKMTPKRWPNQIYKHDRIKKTKNLSNLTEWEDCKLDIFRTMKFDQTWEL